jgi:hypothetical protein
MKTLILILSLACFALRAQTPCDSLAIEYRANITNIQKNFVKSNQEFQVGCGLICAGLWVNMTAIIGKNQDFVSGEQYKQFMTFATVLQITGVAVVFYSHTFINRATIRVSASKITYTFK